MSVRAARLFVFSDFAAHPDALAAYRELAEGAPEGRVAFVLRDRNLDESSRFLLGGKLGEVARAGRQHFLVSGTAALALALGADGVHSPSGDQAPRAVRAGLPSGAWLSRAAHDFETLDAAGVAALDALVVSPVWSERKGRAALGEEGLRHWIERVRAVSRGCAVIALGGATGPQISLALSLGASAVAAMGAALDRDARAGLVAALRQLECVDSPFDRNPP